jgi:uncharacterized membrane protein SirB2
MARFQNITWWLTKKLLAVLIYCGVAAVILYYVVPMVVTQTDRFLN